MSKLRDALRIGKIICASGFFCLSSLSANSAECGCAHVAADSNSTTGVCRIQESGSNYCTLSWSHGAGTEKRDEQRESIETERVEGFLSTSPAQSFFFDTLDGNALGSLQDLAPDSKQARITTGAATYLESVQPKVYEASEALASFVVMLAGVTNSDTVSTLRSVLLPYISANADTIFARLVGENTDEASVTSTDSVHIGDLSGYGCLELRLLNDPSDLSNFRLRLAVRTPFAGGSSCGMR